MFKKARSAVAQEYSGAFSFSRGLWADFKTARETDGLVDDGDDEVVTEARFRLRYANARRQAFVLLGLLFAMVLWTAWVAQEGSQIAVSSSILASLLMAMVYLKSAFRLWVGRRMLRQWPNHQRSVLRMNVFYGVVVDSPRELWPLQAPKGRRMLRAPPRRAR